MRLSRSALQVVALLLLTGCAAHVPRPVRHPLRQVLPRIRYSVQVGAFAQTDNALRLIETLGRRGLEAFFFVGADGLHRVRFGSFSSKDAAVQRAETFRAEGVVDAYYVLPPEMVQSGGDDAALRDEIVRSAKGFMGRPYRWGGPSAETGFDCSGLTMTAYRLSGLALPRTAMAQYSIGESVSERRLQRADLVFFATERGHKPTHVGLYVGDGRFIHAPGHGGVVRVNALADDYYQRRFLGARSYLSADTR